MYSKAVTRKETLEKSLLHFVSETDAAATTLAAPSTDDEPSMVRERRLYMEVGGTLAGGGSSNGACMGG